MRSIILVLASAILLVSCSPERKAEGRILARCFGGTQAEGEGYILHISAIRVDVGDVQDTLVRSDQCHDARLYLVEMNSGVEKALASLGADKARAIALGVGFTATVQVSSVKLIDGDRLEASASKISNIRIMNSVEVKSFVKRHSIL